MPPSPTHPAGADGFDFLFGEWRVHHRRLRRRLVGDREWDEFAGRTVTRSLLGGLGNVDENRIELPSGTYEAITLRLFRPAEAEWSIWWVDGRDPTLQPPVRGRFQDGIGTFFGDDELDGRPIRVRFVWSDITANSARWAQAFSADGGASWETNWTMAFERAA